MPSFTNGLVLLVSKEISLLNTTPWFLTDDEDLTEQLLSVIQSFRLLHAEVLGPINKTRFSKFSSRNLLVSQFFLYKLCIPLVLRIGMFYQATKKYRAEYHQHNSES